MNTNMLGELLHISVPNSSYCHVFLVQAITSTQPCILSYATYTHTLRHTSMYACIHQHKQAQTHTHTCIHICLYAYICVDIHMFMHTYTLVYTHTLICTHMHIPHSLPLNHSIHSKVSENFLN